MPLTPATTALLRDYLAMHPRRNEPTAPLFPNVRLQPPRPAGIADPLTLNQELQQPGIEPGSRETAHRQATALGDLSTAEAGERLVLDWTAPNRHATFYKAVFRPAVLRANRLAAVRGDLAAALPPQLKFHARGNVREPLYRGGAAAAGGGAVHGPRQGHHDAGRLRTPVCRRLRRRDGCSRGDGDC